MLAYMLNFYQISEKVAKMPSTRYATLRELRAMKKDIDRSMKDTIAVIKLMIKPVRPVIRIKKRKNGKIL